MIKWFIIGLLLFFSTPVLASDMSLYFIQPQGEGDTESAKPYLANLYDYLAEETQVKVSGQYLNDTEDALEAFKKERINLAIVSPEFLEKYQQSLKLKTILKTIPTYSAGPYEKYYIMAQKDVKVLDLMQNEIPIELYGSKTYTTPFLNDKIFSKNEEIKKIHWQLKESPNILTTIKAITAGESQAFVLLTGYEFSVINNLKRSHPDFAALKLVFSSKELPSSALVLVGSQNHTQLQSIKKALLSMPTSLKGNLVLKKLRLKGFAEL